MTKTTNQQLPQWEAHDPIRRADFNDAMSAIDAALSSRCRIVYGTYFGNWDYGVDLPTTLTFDFKPMLVFVGSDTGANEYRLNPTVFLRGRTVACADVINSGKTQCYNMRVAWTENGLSFYSTENAAGQNNGGTTYYYVALGVDLPASTAGEDS